MPGRRSSDSESSRSSAASSSRSSSHVRSRSPSPARNGPSLGVHSSSALILVHDDEEDAALFNDNASFSFSDDDDDLASGDDSLHVFSQPSSPSPATHPSQPPLPPSTAFVHFLSQCLKLGAIHTLTSNLSLRYAIPALLAFSALAAFARQIWFLLARYVRKAELGDVLVEAFTKRKGQEGRKKAIRESVRWGTITVRWVLAVVYLRAATSVLVPLLPHTVFFLPAHIFIVLVLTIAIAPLSAAKSLASKRLLYTAWGSVALYVAWLSVAIYAHNVGSLDTDAFPALSGRLAIDIPLLAFTFSTVSTLQLYAGVVQPSGPSSGSFSRGGRASSAGKKERRYQSISSASLGAALLATALLLPLVFPRIKPIGHEYREPSDSNVNLTPDMKILSRLHTLMRTLTALLLLSGVPALLATAPTLPLALPLSVRQRLFPNGGVGEKLRSVSKWVLLGSVGVVTIVLSGDEDGVVGWAGGVLEDAVVVLVLGGSFLVPAIIHITLHAFRRPLSIIVPPSPLTTTSPSHHSPPNNYNNTHNLEATTSTANYPTRSNYQVQRTASASDSDTQSDDPTTPLTRAPGAGASVQAHPYTRARESNGTPRERTFKASSSNTHLSSYQTQLHPPPPPPPPPPAPDATTLTLLQRKERALQRRRFGRRVFWDVGVWLGLAPVSVGGVVWAVGRAGGMW